MRVETAKQRMDNRRAYNERKAPSKRKPNIKETHYVDIRNYPFKGGEVIVTYDNELAALEYTLIVEDVEEVEEGVLTILHCRVISQGHPLHKSGEQYKIRLNKFGPAFLGFVASDIYMDDPESTPFFGTALKSQLRYALIAYLRVLDTKNYTAHIRDVILHFAKLEIIPSDNDYYDESRPPGKRQGPDFRRYAKLILNSVRESSESDLTLTIENKKYIRYNPNAAGRMDGVLKDSNAIFTENVKVIDRDKFVKGIILLVESGVLGGPVSWR